MLSLTGFDESEAARAPRPPDLGRRGADVVVVVGFIGALGCVVAEDVDAVAEADELVSVAFSESAPNNESNFEFVLLGVLSNLEDVAVDGV